MSISGSVARRYARALMEIGLESGKLRQIQQELKRIAESVEVSEELRNVLKSPAVLTSQRKQVLEILLQRLGVNQTVRNTCMLLVDRGRAEVLPAISHEFETMVDEHEGVLRAEVTSSTALNKVYLDRLAKALQSVTGKRIELTAREDRELIGGVITRVGGVVYDGSIKARLSRVRELMLH